jgi:class 3 adenylate cyclase/tetratricopeptide (TPR) repeat protein
VTLCPACSEENPPEARFCSNCGTELKSAGRAQEGLRKTVTVIFSDMVGSTALGEKLDPESFLNVMAAYYNAMRQAVEVHGGTVEKFIGDAVMAVFGVPRLHEDDALRAVRAAVEMQAALARLNDDLQELGVQLETRTGVNTGEVLAGSASMRDAIVVGDPVNTAARLEQAAKPGQVLLGETTYQLVRGLVETEAVEPLSLKGKTDPVPAYRLISIPEVQAWTRPEGTPFLSRRMELAYLETEYEAAVEANSCRLVTITGSPGVGKTRLAQEFVELARRKANVLFGRCLPYGDGITYWPVIEVLRGALGVSEDAAPDEIRSAIATLIEGSEVAPRLERDIASLFGLSDEAVAAEELQWAVRKLLEVFARGKPLVVVFEDVHWGEGTFLDLIEHFVRWSRAAPILMLCLGRPELLERRTSWRLERKRSDALVLEPLSAEAVETLVDRLVPGLDEGLRRRIVSAAAGLPLFVHSIISMLIDQQVLRRHGDEWETVGEVDTVIVPPTVQAVLSARLERLNSEERALIERASLVGEEFSIEDVLVLSPAAEHADLPSIVETLVRRDLIRTVPGRDGTFRFTHMLIRDITYREMPKKVRADLHERFADWVRGVSAERTHAHDEILGYHLEQAFRLRTELRPGDPANEVLGARAAEVLKIAGRRAVARHDVSASVSLLSRSIDLSSPDDRDRLLLKADLARALMDVGRLDEAAAVAEQGVEEARGTGDTAAEHLLRIRRDEIALNVTPSTALQEVLDRSDEALRFFEAAGDRDGLALALQWTSSLRFWLGHAEVALEGFERALELATGRPSLTATILAFEAAARIYGPTPAAEIERWSSAVLAVHGGIPTAEAAVLSARAFAAALKGNASSARQLANRARSIYADMGLLVLLARATSILSLIELLVGDLAAAERGLREAHDVLDETGETGFLSSVTSMLADVLCEQERFDEAEEIARRAIEISSPDDIDPLTRAKGVLALARARAGDAVGAEAIALEAVELSRSTDLIMILCDALRRLGQVLNASGKTEAGARALGEALALYDRKGNTVMADRVRAMLGAAEADAGA